MALLSSLDLHNLRNISQASLLLHPHWNLIYGANGSGKTAILEAIYCLSQTHSFRFNQGTPLIQHEQEKLYISAILKEPLFSTELSITKTQAGETFLLKAGLRERSRAECAKRLPVQILTPDSFRLMLDGPVQRRAFLDWGVFHVEHRYSSVWQAYQRALRQRNKLLKERRGLDELIAWEEALDTHGSMLTDLRQQYLRDFSQSWQEAWGAFAQISQLHLELDPGWDARISLKEAFVLTRDQERRIGHTIIGPHRAELNCQIFGLPAAQILSRGQLKLLICAMFIAQAKVLTKLTNKTSILLCDDLACELDAVSRKKVIDVLQTLPNQIFVTAIDPESLRPFLKESLQMFHVEQGVVSPPHS